MDSVTPQHTQSGFTLLEVLLVVALVAIVAGFSASVGSGFLWRTDLRAAQVESVVSLRRAQTLAQTMANDSDWGVRIEDNLLTLFKGSDFENRDPLFDEEYGLGSTAAKIPVEIVYRKFSGRPYQSFSEIQLTASSETAIITVNSEGTVDY